ncbi:MAG: hypothetical protein RL071_95, partial [Pseudomonadota bacterium]
MPRSDRSTPPAGPRTALLSTRPARPRAPVLLSEVVRSALVLFAVVLGVVGAPGRAAARDWPNADLVAQAELPLPADHLTAKLSDL